MANTSGVNTPTWREWKQTEKLSIKKLIKRSGIAALIIALTAAGWDMYFSNKRKTSDKEKYWSIEMKNDKAKTFEEANDNIVYIKQADWTVIDSLSLPNFFDKILEQNWYNSDSISSTDLTTTMTSENALKTDWLIMEIDQELEDWGIDRSKNSGSIIWKILSLKWNWSYWRFQTQREAIENWYKSNPIRYNNICKKIANFKLPNNNGERKELYKQFWKTENEMINDLKEKNLPMYKWGNMLGIAFWVVLLNEQLVDRYEWWERYNEGKVIRRTQWIKAKYLSGLHTKDPIRQALNRENTKGENLKSIYILSKQENWWNRTSFKDIQNTLQSPEFRAWEISAWWCTRTEARKNGEYLLNLNIAELNQRFNNEIGGTKQTELKITTPTGGFGPTTTKLAVEHLKNYLHENILKKAESKDIFNNGSFQQEVKEYLNQNPELMKEFKDKIIGEYIRNFQRLFLLNGNKEIKNGTRSNWENLSEEQMNFLEQNLNLSFNHIYIWVQEFKKYVNNKETSEKLDKLWDDYIIKQKKWNRKEITEILTHKDKFINFTWLSEKKYETFIKHHLGPALLWTSIILSETWNVVPENQEPANGTSNEINTIYRFCAWTENQIKKINEAKKWILITTTEWDISIKTIKEAITKNKTIMEYIQNNCRSNELIKHFINIQSTENWNKIYFNTRNTKQIVGDEKLLCVVRGKGDTFCDYIFDLQQQNDTLSAILKRIIWKDSIELKDITKWVVRQLIRKPDWSLWENLNEIHPEDTFLIVYPLTSGKPQAIDTSNVTPILTILPPRGNLKATTKTTKEEIGETLSEKPNAKDWAKWNRNIQNSRKKVPLPKRSSTPAKRHTHQKR